MRSARTNVSLLLPRLFLLLPLPPDLVHPSETLQVSGHMELQIRRFAFPHCRLATRYCLAWGWGLALILSKMVTWLSFFFPLTLLIQPNHSTTPGKTVKMKL